MDYYGDDDQSREKPQEQRSAKKYRQNGNSRLSLVTIVLGITTLIFCWFPLLSLATGITGMIFAIIAVVKEERKGKPIAGMLLLMAGLSLAAFFTLGYLIRFLSYINVNSAYY